MSISADNPVGLKSVDHMEFTANERYGHVGKLFHSLGFQKSATNEKYDLYDQGQIRFLLTSSTDESEHSARYRKDHGEGVSKIAFRVENAEESLNIAIKRGGELVQDLSIEETEFGPIKRAAIKGLAMSSTNSLSAQVKLFIRG